MAVQFYIVKYINEYPISRKIIKYLMKHKAATIYQIAEGIREKPSQFEEDLSVLQDYEIVSLASEEVYIITGFGHEVATIIEKSFVAI